MNIIYCRISIKMEFNIESTFESILTQRRSLGQCYNNGF
jgi:hypothetical protein